MDAILASMAAAATPWQLAFILLGTVLGVIVGAIPGLSTLMLITLSLPLTFYMSDGNALAMLVISAILVWTGQQIAELGTAQGWVGFAVLFVGGWILQLVGHVFEGRKPALVDNLFQIFVAPIFLAAEVFFALGYKPELRRRLSSYGRIASSAPSS